MCILQKEKSKSQSSEHSPQETRKRREIKSKVSRRKETIKIRAEFNAIEIGNQQKKTPTKPKVGSLKRYIKLISLYRAK